MTENAVIKALEEEIHFAKYVDSSCCNNVELTLIICALNLINRQKAEKETMQSYIDCLKAENERLERHTEMYHELRVEAIKEFWGKLKEQNTMDARIVSVASGDNLLKEMTGGKT